MEQNLKIVELKDLEAGLQLKSSDLALDGEFARFPLTSGSINWSYGRRKGITTRYGIMPFPGHCSTHNLDAHLPLYTLMSGKQSNLVHAEGNENTELPATPYEPTANLRDSRDLFINRKSVLGALIISQPVQPRSNARDYPVLYWICVRERNSTTLGKTYQFDLVPSTKWGTSASNSQEVVSQYEASIGGGGSTIPYSNVSDTGESEANKFLMSTQRLLTSDLVRLRKLNTVPWFASVAELSYSFGFYSQDFIAFPPSFGAAGARPADLYFMAAGFFYPLKVAANEKAPMELSVLASAAGASAFQVWAAKVNTVAVYETKENLAVRYGLLRVSSSDVTSTPTTTEETKAGEILANTANITWTVVQSVTPGSYKFVYCKSNIKPIAVRASVYAFVVDGKPIVVCKNPYVADKTEMNTHAEKSYFNTQCPYSNDYQLWMSPTQNEWGPRDLDTFSEATIPGTIADPYKEDGIARKTCWGHVRPFVSGTTSANVIVNRGILKKQRVYEYAFSIYNGITGQESNVGTPAKVDTGGLASDSGAILISASTYPQFDGTSYIGGFAFPTVQDLVRSIAGPSATFFDKFPYNYFSFRLYYREIGSFEWIFSGEHSFAKVYGRNLGEPIYIGQGDQVGLPGPQPGGYIDNSPLQSDNYLEVVSFLGKLWWVSKDTVRFSSKENPMSYPLRNFISVSSGEFIGARVHFFPGQAEARARLVIFGTKAVYDVRQTTEFQYTQVRVSATSQPQAVPIPDSNIIVSERSTHTAFSGRCSVVAEGVLYYWGPTGIFRDDGVSFPVRISDDIEPDLFTSYDNAKTSEFFAHYNKKSQEILFFFRPVASSSYKTVAWVYSIRTEAWSQGRPGAWIQYGYDCIIDWAQELNLNGFAGGVVGGTLERSRGSGNRTAIGVRATSAATVSRVFFHDDECDCGDMKPGNEMMVTAVTRIDSTTLRLTFPNESHVNGILTAATAGSAVYLASSVDYGGLSASVDGKRTVKAKDLVSRTIDVSDANSAFAGSWSAPTNRDLFPCFFAATHSFTGVLDTTFFAFFGMSRWCRFRHSHLLIQPVERKAGDSNATATIFWNCNHALSVEASKVITVEKLATNEKTSQVIFDMASPGMQTEGQGLEVRVVYNQIGGRWSLFAWTFYVSDSEGRRNLNYYQQ